MIYLRVEYVGADGGGYAIPNVYRWFPGIPSEGESITMRYERGDLGVAGGNVVLVTGDVVRVSWIDEGDKVVCILRYA
jgi:hypothetical protein